MADLDPAALDAYLKGQTPRAPDEGPVIGPAIRRGAGQLVTGVGGLGEFLGFPTEYISEYGRGVTKRAGPPRYELGDIFSHPIGTVGEIVAEQLPLLATQVAAGIVSGGATVPASVTAAAPSVVRGLGMAAARRTAGGVIGEGSIAASTLGSIYADQPEEDKSRTRALLTGIPSHFLERTGGEALARGLGQGLVKRGAEERLLPFMAKQGLRTALIEGPLTEVPQTFLEQIGTRRPLNVGEALEAGAKGAIAGGVIGSGLGMFTPRERQDLQDEIRTTADEIRNELAPKAPAQPQTAVEAAPPDVRLRFDLNRQLAEAGAAPVLPEVPGAAPTLADVRGAALPGFEIPPGEPPPPGGGGGGRAPFPTLGEAITITGVPPRPPRPPSTRGIRVEELPVQEAMDLAAVQELPVTEELTLGPESTPEALERARQTAIAQRAAELTGQPTGAVGLALQSALSRAAGAQETAAQQQAREAAFAQAERDAEIARLIGVGQLTRTAQRTRLEEAATAIEKGALPPQRFMRPDVDTVLDRTVGDIVATGGKARMPPGLRAKIYGALKLGQAKTNYGLQIAGLTRLHNSLDPQSKSYEVVGRLLDQLRGVADVATTQAAQQTAATRAGVQPAEGAAAVSRPGEPVPAISPSGEQGRARNVPAAPGPSAPAEEIGGQRGTERPVRTAKRGAPAPAKPTPAAEAAGGARRPETGGERPAAAEARGPGERPSAARAPERAGGAPEGVRPAVGARAPSGPSAERGVAPAKPADRTPEAGAQPERPGVPEVRGRAGAGAAPVQPSGGRGGKPAPAAPGAAKPAPEARNVPKPVPTAPAAGKTAVRKRSDAGSAGLTEQGQLTTAQAEEPKNAIRERSAEGVHAREAPTTRERVREENAEREKAAISRATQRKRDAKTRNEPLGNAIKQIAIELGFPAESLNAAFAPLEEKQPKKKKRTQAAQVYTWAPPDTAEDALRETVPVDYALSELKDIEVPSAIGRYTRAWWYDVNWIRALIQSKGESHPLGKKMVNDPTQGGKKVPLWEWYSRNIRATPAQIAQAAERVEAYEREDRKIIKQRQEANEKIRQAEIAFREQLERDGMEAQKASRDAVKRTEGGTRKERRAKLQKKAEPEPKQSIRDMAWYSETAIEEAASIGPTIKKMVVAAGANGIALNKVLQAIASKSTNSYTRFFASMLQAVPLMVEVRLYSGEHIPESAKARMEQAVGLWNPNTNGIYLRPDTDVVSGGMNPLTVLHEALHAATYWKIEIVRNFLDKHNSSQVADLSIDLPEFRGAILLTNAMGAARSEAKRRGLETNFEHELSDLHEFIAGAFTEPSFQHFLATVTLPENLQTSLSKFFQAPIRSLWDTFVLGVQRLLGINSTEETKTILEAVIKLSPTLFSDTRATRDVGLKAATERARRRGNITEADVASRPSVVMENMGEVATTLGGWLGDKRWISSLKTKAFDTALGWLTLFEMKEMFQRQFPQLNAYFDLKSKQQRLVTLLNNESGDLISRWERLNSKHDGWDPTKGRDHPISVLYNLMSTATLNEYFPDKGIYEQPATETRSRAEADEWFKTEAGEKWVKATEESRRLWRSLNDKDPALGRLFTESHRLNKKRYDQSAQLFKKAIIDNMFDGVFPENVRDADADTKERWLRDQLEVVKPSGAAPDPRMVNVINAALKPLDSLAARMAEVRGPYFHLGRFGQWGIRWVDDNGSVNMKRFENYGEFLEAVQTFTSQGIHKRTAKEDGKDKDVWYAARLEDKVKEFDQGSDRFLQSMMQKIDQQYADDVERAKILKQAIRQMYLQMLPDTAFFKVFQKRKGVPGWDPDMLRAYAHRMEIMNRTIGYNSFTRELQKAVGDFRAVVDDLGKEVSDEASLKRAEQGAALVSEIRQREANAVRQPDTPVVDLLTSLNYMFYLALSPAYVVTNLTQPWLITMPFLGGRHGWVASAKQLAVSSKKAWAAVRFLVDNALGVSRDASLATQLASAGRPSVAFDKMPFLSSEQKEFLQHVAAFGQIDLTLAHEIGEVAKVGGTSSWQRTKTIAGLMSHYSEIFNRISAGLAAFDLELARTKDFEKAANYGLKLVRRTQFDYSHANLARQMSKQGIFSKYTPLVMAFQRFNAQLLEAYVDTTLRAFGKLNEGLSVAEQKAQMAEARRTLAGLLGTSAMFAGLMGLPAANLIFAVLDKLFGDDEDPVDTKAEMRRWMADVFGKDLGEAISVGPSRLVGMNFQRVGSQDIVPFTRLLSDKRELKDMLEAQSVELMGPVVGGAFDILQGAKKMMEGDVTGGLKQALPLAVRGLPKAAEMGMGYTTDSRGNRIPVNFNSWDVINQALGFVPPKLAERQAALYTINTQNRRYQQAMTNLRTRYYRALEADDSSRIQDAIGDISSWNRRHPDLPILGSELLQGARRREKVFYTGATYGPGVGAVSLKDLPKLDIAKWANVGGLE